MTWLVAFPFRDRFHGSRSSHCRGLSPLFPAMAIICWPRLLEIHWTGERRPELSRRCEADCHAGCISSPSFVSRAISQMQRTCQSSMGTSNDGRPRSVVGLVSAVVLLVTLFRTQLGRMVLDLTSFRAPWAPIQDKSTPYGPIELRSRCSELHMMQPKTQKLI